MNSPQMSRWPTASDRRSVSARRSAFTLTEVMVALFILVAGMITAAMFFASMARAARFTDSAITATCLAQAKVEDLLEQTCQTMIGGYDASTVYTRSWSVLLTNNLAYIDVTVGWTDAGGHTNTMTLDTIRSP